MVLLSVYMKTLFIGMISALRISSLRRVASKAACNFSLGIDITFIGATRALTRMKQSLIS